jgi:superoxide reductase
VAKQIQIYKCNICGNIVEVLHGGDGELVCCNEPMELLNERTADTGKEKHVPVIEKTDGGYKVKVGGVPHPMEEKHYIEWIELLPTAKPIDSFSSPELPPKRCSRCKQARSAPGSIVVFTDYGRGRS